MLKINILCVGSIKEKFFNEAIEEYLKRLKRFASVTITEVSEQSLLEGNKKVETESELLLSKLNGYSILLDRASQELSSEELAKNIETLSSSTSTMTFVIGGSNGVSEKLKSRVEKTISFGKITFPHQLFRVVLLEQIYRAFTIINKLPYHK